MRAVMVMFDSLNRHYLPPYGNDWVHAPRFAELAERSTTFETSYVCSMPCMPARRDLHTGRPNFLHSSWDPLQPYDDSVPEMLQHAGVETALISDHYHYWEDGGATYHNRYGTWQHCRGQEGDPWIGQAKPEPASPDAHGRQAGAERNYRQDRINRRTTRETARHPQTRTFDAGLDFIDRNADRPNWFLQIETFDPHEPFFVPEGFRDLYAEHFGRWAGPDPWDWPEYGPVTEPPAWVTHMRMQYARLLGMCDHSLGRVLDAFDRHGLWDDTLLIVWTDHGFMLGEHDQWAKNWMPLRDPVARTPFFVWNPRTGGRGDRRQALVQPGIDLGPTLLNAFGLKPTADMLGHDLQPVLRDDSAVRDAGIFGYHGRAVNVTDGRYVYMRGIPGGGNGNNAPLFDYSLGPARMERRLTPDELAADRVTLAEPFAFTKGCPLLKIGVPAELQRNPVPELDRDAFATRLFDTETDPEQNVPVEDLAVEARMVGLLRSELRRADAPTEQYARLGLAGAGAGPG